VLRYGSFGRRCSNIRKNAGASLASKVYPSVKY
jgi:hypothetical protein